MKNCNEIHANTDKWESRKLGAAQEFVKASDLMAKDLQKSVEPQSVLLYKNKEIK